MSAADLGYYVDPDYKAKRGEGIEAAWAEAVAALPRDAWIYSLSVEMYLGTAPGGWIVGASCDRDGWVRHYNGRGSTPAAALLALADFCRKYRSGDKP